MPVIIYYVCFYFKNRYSVCTVFDSLNFLDNFLIYVAVRCVYCDYMKMFILEYCFCYRHKSFEFSVHVQ